MLTVTGRDRRPLIDVVYIGGTGRSGSTIVEHHLARRLHAIGVGETVYLWNLGLKGDERCGCGEPFSRCPFWRDVVEAGHIRERNAAFENIWKEGGHRLSAIPRQLLRGRRDPTIAAAAEAYGELFRAIADAGGAKIVIESSKEPGFWLFLRLVPGIRVHTVHVVRDSRAVAYSWRRLVLKPELAHKRAEHMGVHPFWRSALKWDATNFVFAVIRGRLHDGKFITLRYEDFAANPEPSLDRVRDELGLEVDVTDRPSSDVVHSMSGNPVRFDPERLARVVIDDEWRTKMPRAVRLLVTILSLPLLLAFGYVGGRSG